MATTTGFTYRPALASLAEADRLLQEAYNIIERASLDLESAVEMWDEDHANGVTPEPDLPSYADIGVFHSFADDCRSQIAQLTDHVTRIEKGARGLHLQLSNRGLDYAADVHTEDDIG